MPECRMVIENNLLRHLSVIILLQGPLSPTKWFKNMSVYVTVGLNINTRFSKSLQNTFFYFRPEKMHKTGLIKKIILVEVQIPFKINFLIHYKQIYQTVLMTI